MVRRQCGDEMISKDQMMDVLLDACPSFRPTWDAFRDDWKTSANDLPHYLALADLARHLIGMLERSDTESFAAIFQVVEQMTHPSVDGCPDLSRRFARSLSLEVRRNSLEVGRLNVPRVF